MYHHETAMSLKGSVMAQRAHPAIPEWDQRSEACTLRFQLLPVKVFTCETLRIAPFQHSMSFLGSCG